MKGMPGTAKGSESDATTSTKAAEPLSPLHERFNLTIGGGISERKGKNFHRLRGLHPAIDEHAWYSTYASTLTLLLIVHMLYVKHIWARKLSRRHLLVNYNRLIQKKHYHMAIPALLSHAPTKPASNATSSSTRTVYAGNEDEPQTPIRSVLSRVFASGVLGPFSPGKLLSGLPLLFYCAHILWSCRALEVLYGSGWNYARVLWVLTWTGLACDLGFTYTVLTMLRDMNYATSAPFRMGVNWSSSSSSDRPVARRVERALIQRSMGSLTTTTCAVLFVFREHFDVPIPVIPLLPRGLPVVGVSFFSYAMVIGLLLALSHSIHPVAGVAFGSFAGLLWTSSWTTFLAEPYWNNGTVLAYLAVCLLALKANHTSYLPCIDYVSWDSRGEITYNSDLQGPSTIVEPSNQQNFGDTQNSDDDEDRMDGSGDEEDPLSLELGSRRPQRRISSSSLDHMMDEDNDGDANNDTTPLIPSTPSATAGGTMRSRRPPVGARGG